MKNVKLKIKNEDEDENGVLECGSDGEGSPEGWTPCAETNFQNLASRRPGSGGSTARGVGCSSAIWRGRLLARRGLFTVFQLFPLISTCFRGFDNKNIFQAGFQSPGKLFKPCGGLGGVSWIVTPGNA
jgi:hypothetical protein